MARSCIVGMPRGRLLPFFLGIYTRSQRLGTVAPLSQRVDGLRLLAPGRSRSSPSTPGVRFPWFSVTRRTARALPLNEWVSRCCKALTLPHLPPASPSRYALGADARSGGPCASRWRASPSGRGRPHQQAELLSSACLLGRFAKLSRAERPEGSRPAFAWGDVARCSTPIRADYRPAFAFSLLLYPLPHRRVLRLPTLAGGHRAYRVWRV